MPPVFDGRSGATNVPDGYLDVASRDFYKVLEVEPGASAEEIRRSYKRLARENHPDRNQGDDAAEERFKEVTRAYEVLSDDAKRNVYDELGMEAEAIDFDPEKARTYRQWAEQQARGPRGSSGGKGGGGPGQPDLSEIFGDLFGSGGGFGGFGGFGTRAPSGPRPGPDIRTEMQVSFRDAVLGAERRISLDRPGEPRPCARCGGSGRIQANQGGLDIQVPCPQCGGEGTLPGPVERATLDVRIPAGVSDGQSIRLKGQGSPGVRGGVSGDLLIRLSVGSHPKLRREGLDLHLDLPITLSEAMLGGEVEIPTLEGKKVRVRVPAGVKVGQKLRLGGKGVSRGKSGGAGDLYAHLQVVLPNEADREDPEIRDAIAKIEAAYEGSVRDGLDEL